MNARAAKPIADDRGRSPGTVRDHRVDRFCWGAVVHDLSVARQVMQLFFVVSVEKCQTEIQNADLPRPIQDQIRRLANRLHLTKKTGEGPRVARSFLRKYLERHEAVEPPVPRLVNTPHPPGAKQSYDLIVANRFELRTACSFAFRVIGKPRVGPLAQRDRKISLVRISITMVFSP
jgi:hypothetical protein